MAGVPSPTEYSVNKAGAAWAKIHLDARLISVCHMTCRAMRERLEAYRSDGNEISTDEFRDAFRRYRDSFDRLLQV